jgi:3-dehydroquinate synthase
VARRFGVRFVDGLPPTFARTDGRVPLLLFDARLDADPILHRRFAHWVRRHPFRLPIAAGETLKSVATLPGLLRRIVPVLERAGGPVAVVAAGGGSVGDVAGFVASMLRRGVPLTHVPTTWLAAMDSAHGGKNAMNVGGVKNVVGTFHLPEAVWVSRHALRGQPEALAEAALGEAIKAALLDGRSWTRAFREAMARGTPERVLWRFLPEIVKAKYRWVRRDPNETNGLRRVLNFGHTVGHVLEAAHRVPHGLAVAEGMRFAVELGLREGVTPERVAKRVREDWLEAPWCPRRRAPRALDAARFRALLAQDKKSVRDGRIAFVFLARPGKPVVRPVSIDVLVKEARRQGWCR